MKKPSHPIPQVAVLMPLTLKSHPDVFNGIPQYARPRPVAALPRMEGRAGDSEQHGASIRQELVRCFQPRVAPRLPYRLTHCPSAADFSTASHMRAVS